MNEEVSADEIRELLQYIENIKGFERKYKLQLAAVERITWGLLLITAGILDFIFAGYLMGYGPIFIPWVLIIPVGLLMNNFLTKRTQIIEEQKTKKVPIYLQPTNIGFVLAIIAMIVFSRPALYFLIMPSIAAIFGTTILIDNILFQKEKFQNRLKIFKFLTPILIILTAVINILGYFFIEVNLESIAIEYSSFTIFHGIIFGFTFGIMMIIEAYLTKRMMSK